MKITCTAILAVIVFLTLANQPAYARYPILQQHYKFDPHHSMFTVSGGFMGVDYAYSINGTFNLNIDYRNQEAWFSDVDAIVTLFPSIAQDAVLNYPDIFLDSDLDELINLSTLEGRIVNNITQIAFTGTDNQGALMLLGVTLDTTPWRLLWPDNRMLRMKGNNDPPCCDFFNMGIDASARRVPWLYPYMPGDTDGDAAVTLIDLDTLGRNFGNKYAIEVEQGDFNGDGEVSLLDLDILGHNYGLSPTSIPEPITLATLALAAAVAINRRR